MSMQWMRALYALLVVSVPATASAADATLIPVDHLVSDIAYDAHRNMIYMADGSSILRYDLGLGAFQTPITITGGPLNGIDLSPDGRTLAAADTDMIAVKVHLIDLDTLADKVRSDKAGPYEVGVYQVAYTRDGNLLVTTNISGSGTTSLRKLDAVTGAFTLLTAPGSDPFAPAALSTSGDGRIVGIAEGNISSGAWRIYNARTGAQTRYLFGTSTFNTSIAANADGSRFTLNGFQIYDANNQGVISIHNGTLYPTASVDDPVLPIGYFAFDGSSLLGVYDLTNYSLQTTYDFGAQFAHPVWVGNAIQPLRLSRDGSMLVARFSDGVRYLRLYAGLGADNVSSSTIGQRVDITLLGHIGNNGPLTYDIRTQPGHGQAFVRDNVATYVPAPGFDGQDSFVYRVHYGQAWADGTVTVNVTADTSAYVPQVSFDTLPVLHATTPIPGSTHVAGDFNGDGVSDLLWFNPGTSQLGYWTMQPVTAATLADPSVRRTGARTFSISPGYFVGAMGDFDGDGYADLMFTSDNHDLWLWSNSRTSGWRSTRLYDYPAGWQLVGAGDIDGDGKDDLLWLDPSECQFGYWLMNGNVRKGASTFPIACGYYPVAVGYFTPTNRISVLWSSAAKDLYIWDSRGTGFRSYDLGTELTSQGYAGFGMSQVWALGGGSEGKGIGLEWSADGAGGALVLNRTFDAQGNQIGFDSTQSWYGGLWGDNSQAASYLVTGGLAPGSALYALDPNRLSIQTGGFFGGDAETSGTAPRAMTTEWDYPVGWYPVGAPGSRALPLPWR